MRHFIAFRIGAAAAFALFVLFVLSIIVAAQGTKECVPDDVQAIFTRSCARPTDQCHSSDNPAAVNLVLESSQAYRNLVKVKSVEHPDMLRVNPGRPAQSFLWHKVRHSHLKIGGRGYGMPPEETLPDSDIALIERWILSLDPCANPVAHHVVIISLDGVSPDVLKQAKIPYIDALWQKGSYSWKAKTVTSSTTLSSYVSMFSSVLPKQHGFDKVPMLFTLAQQAGLTIAAYVGNEALNHLISSSTFGHFEYLKAPAIQIAEAAAKYIATVHPHLCFVHLPDPDVAGHKFGWLSPQHIRAIEDCDKAVGTLVSALNDSKVIDDTVVILTSDHGGHATPHGSDFEEDIFVPWIMAGRGVHIGHELNTSIIIMDTAPTVAYVLGLETPKEWRGKPVREAFIREQKKE